MKRGGNFSTFSKEWLFVPLSIRLITRSVLASSLSKERGVRVRHCHSHSQPPSLARGAAHPKPTHLILPWLEIGYDALECPDKLRDAIHNAAALRRCYVAAVLEDGWVNALCLRGGDRCQGMGRGVRCGLVSVPRAVVLLCDRPGKGVAVDTVPAVGHPHPPQTQERGQSPGLAACRIVMVVPCVLVPCNSNVGE